MSRKLIIAAIAAVAVNGLALAESDRGSTASQVGDAAQRVGSAMSDASSQQLTPDQFVKQAAAGNEFEIQSAKLAEKSDDPMVKQMAKDMRKDHEKAQDQLKSAAKRSGITVSSTLDPQHQQMIDQLQGKTGDQFSQIYNQQQLQAHQQSVDLYQRASTQLQDQDLKSYAQKTLPKLQEHLTMVQSHQKMAQQGSMQSPQAQPAGGNIPGQMDQNRQDQPNPDTMGNENPGTAGQGISPSPRK
jgi:putative membrane protein